MSLARLRMWDWLTGAAGLALLVLMFAHWYELPDGSLTAWQAFTLVDLWLALTGLAGLAVPVVTALRDTPTLPVFADVVATALALVSLPVMLWRLLDTPGVAGVEVDRAWGVFAGALAVLVLAVAAWQTMGDERAPGQRAHPPVDDRPVPPPGAGPEPTDPPT